MIILPERHSKLYLLVEKEDSLPDILVAAATIGFDTPNVFDILIEWKTVVIMRCTNNLSYAGLIKAVVTVGSRDGALLELTRVRTLRMVSHGLDQPVA